MNLFLQSYSCKTALGVKTALDSTDVVSMVKNWKDKRLNNGGS